MQQPAPVNETVTFKPNPHMCYRNSSGGLICEVYTEYSKPIDFMIGLNPSITNENSSDDTCKYPFCKFYEDAI